MKSGPVFLWRGSVALLCEACQCLMIRWNIQTPATRRQAHWYVVIPNRGLSYSDPQTFMHVHMLTAQTYTVHTRTLQSVDLWLNHGIKGIHSKVTGRKTNDRRDSETAIWLLIPAMCSKVEKKKRYLPPHLDEQIVNNSTRYIHDACCDPWFFTASQFCKKKAW